MKRFVSLLADGKIEDESVLKRESFSILSMRLLGDVRSLCLRQSRYTNLHLSPPAKQDANRLKTFSFIAPSRDSTLAQAPKAK